MTDSLKIKHPTRPGQSAPGGEFGPALSSQSCIDTSSLPLTVPMAQTALRKVIKHHSSDKVPKNCVTIFEVETSQKEKTMPNIFAKE